MEDFRSSTYEEISAGATESVTLEMTATDVEALALAAGDVDPLQLQDAGVRAGASAPGLRQSP